MPVYTTVCPRNCYSTCTMKVHVENGRLRRIEPHAGNKATFEGPCLKGLSYVEREHSPDRILHPMRDILFDEKIAGSFHFTPGNAYDEADNGNRSTVHWDLVCLQDPAHGGGEIYFDDVLIRKDGRFVHDAFKALNPENLRLN